MITDQQIRELRDSLIAEAEKAGEAGACVNTREFLADCNDALDADSENRHAARARCAEILNVRRLA